MISKYQIGDCLTQKVNVWVFLDEYPVQAGDHWIILNMSKSQKTWAAYNKLSMCYELIHMSGRRSFFEESELDNYMTPMVN